MIGGFAYDVLPYKGYEIVNYGDFARVESYSKDYGCICMIEYEGLDLEDCRKWIDKNRNGSM